MEGGDEFSPGWHVQHELHVRRDRNPCVECEVPGADDFVPSEIVAHTVQSAPVSDLRLVVAAYGDRLLFSPERGAVFVIGVPCDERRISKMVFVSTDQARSIEALGVRSLATFLEDQTADAAGGSSEDERGSP